MALRPTGLLIACKGRDLRAGLPSFPRAGTGEWSLGFQEGNPSRSRRAEDQTARSSPRQIKGHPHARMGHTTPRSGPLDTGRPDFGPLHGPRNVHGNRPSPSTLTRQSDEHQQSRSRTPHRFRNPPRRRGTCPRPRNLRPRQGRTPPSGLTRRPSRIPPADNPPTPPPLLSTLSLPSLLALFALPVAAQPPACTMSARATWAGRFGRWT